jgi:hypothetical protein
MSIAKPVNGVQGTCLTSLLGLDYEDGVDLLCLIGLLRRGHSRTPNAITVVMAAWDKFIKEELLGDVMETVTKTAVSHTLYYFINYGKKSLLKHHPIDQFNGTLSKPSRQIANLHNRQRRFHKKLSQLVTSITIYNNLQQERSMPGQEEDSSSDESVEKEPTEFILGSMPA